MKHTPGPWTAIPQNDKRHRCVVVMSETGNKQDNGRAQIACCYISHVEWETAIANAHVAAAGPQLLSALEEALNQLETNYMEAISKGHRWTNERVNMTSAAKHRAKEAIAKARRLPPYNLPTTKP